MAPFHRQDFRSQSALDEQNRDGPKQPCPPGRKNQPAQSIQGFECGDVHDFLNHPAQKMNPNGHGQKSQSKCSDAEVSQLKQRCEEVFINQYTIDITSQKYLNVYEEK